VPRPLWLRALSAFSLSAFSLCACSSSSPVPPIQTLDQSVASLRAKVNHIVVIYQENWSFDAQYGKFPGANGIANASPATETQVYCTAGSTTYTPLATLPAAYTNVGAPSANGCSWSASQAGAQVDSRVPTGKAVAPFDLAPYIPTSATTGDIIHRFWHQQLQIDNGVLETPANGAYSGDKYVTWSDNQGLVFSQYDSTNLPEGQLAQKYTLADNFFHSAYGGSYLNHQWLICSCSPVWSQALPTSTTTALSSWDPATKTLNDGFLTNKPIASAAQLPPGTGGPIYTVNTMYTVNSPHPASTKPDQLAQGFTGKTIGDSLTDASPSITWKWYSGGWDNALAGAPDATFQFHHQPFNYYARWGADGSANKAAHLQDEAKFFTDVSGGTLPSVSFIKPLGANNEHPGYADLIDGQNHVAQLVAAIQNSAYWKDTAIIITYDEFGGRWDHVSPPATTDGWGPGARVPALIISPFARRGYVDHTQYETVSILKLIETRFNLQPLGSRDSTAANLLNAFNFSQTTPASAVRSKAAAARSSER
jgi:acid phosphatase